MSFFGSNNGYNNGYNNGGYNNNGYNGNGNGYNSQSFYQHIMNYVGQTVTIFTTSGGASGCGFSGVILAVTCDYVRLSTQQGTPPSNPLSETICDRDRDRDRDRDYGCNGVGGAFANGGANNFNGNGGFDNGHCHHDNHYTVGSIVDIPIDRIAAFCHNAI